MAAVSVVAYAVYLGSVLSALLSSATQIVAYRRSFPAW